VYNCHALTRAHFISNKFLVDLMNNINALHLLALSTQALSIENKLNRGATEMK